MYSIHVWMRVSLSIHPSPRSRFFMSELHIIITLPLIWSRCKSLSDSVAFMLNAMPTPLGHLTLWNNTLLIKKEITVRYYTIKHAQTDGGCVQSAQKNHNDGNKRIIISRQVNFKLSNKTKFLYCNGSCSSVHVINLFIYLITVVKNSIPHYSIFYKAFMFTRWFYW